MRTTLPTLLVALALSLFLPNSLNAEDSTNIFKTVNFTTQ